ncbi:tRNA pseudouridine(55) synthase TruB [Ruania halotolerans]|uniref:tRNA pseudouridine(55) synthase TruB n=1 Tax=Ruania halotolerans TaxID=2897773 RepID=UPI001E3042E1|nr:tRNA pseudouridine(55) synthase TruB [Ruania halotolerans]UFU05181.1 tRNA pseudouridine(55) synthase TruB [Ruania halotolerans]
MSDGLVLIDKPQGWTSHDVVARSRRLLHTRKVGHAGTLDPMATGLLVLGVDRATRLLTYLVGADKDYAATIRLGQATVTDDAEGEIVTTGGLDQAGGPDVVRNRLGEAVCALTGEIDQVPSAVSAIKVDGKRSYARVRSGEQVELAARPVTVHAFDVADIRETVATDGTPVLDVDVSVTCSSGTYIRALARDLGAALGTGGHLTALRRTRVGPFDLTRANAFDENTLTLSVVDVATVLRAAFTVRTLTEDEARELRFGRRIGATGTEAVVAGLAPDGHGVALLQDADARARPILVLDPA